MKIIGKWQGLDSLRGTSVLKLALSVGNITSGAAGMVYAMPPRYLRSYPWFKIKQEPVDLHRSKIAVSSVMTSFYLRIWVQTLYLGYS